MTKIGGVRGEPMENASSINASEPSDSVYEELLKVQVRRLRQSPIAVASVAAVIAGISSEHVWAPLPIGWLALLLAIVGARLILFPKLAVATHIGIRKRLQVMVLMHGLTGIALGLSLFFFPHLPGYERAIHSMLLVAICAGAVSTTVGYLPMVLSYIVPILVPLAVLWFTGAGRNGAGWIELATSGLVMFLIFLLIALARDAFKLIRDSFEIRFHQVETNAQLREALDRAETANRAKTRFLASASHDLRQPIHALTVYSAALAMRPLDERSKTIMQNMDEALQALSSELDALLDVSKLDAGLVSVNRKTVALKPLLERIRDSFQKTASEKNLRLALQCPYEIFVHTDAAHFERILRNLVENAIKYTDAGRVTISATVEAGAVKLSVSDTGSGIPQEEHERIFEEFYQLDNPERDRERGLGLGLAIVRRLVALLGIDLRLSSTPRVGSAFALSMPATVAMESAAPPSVEMTTGLTGLHVLLVDDERTVRHAMRELLEMLGCHVSEADSTQGATASARTDSPDIALVDFRLRGKDNGIATIDAVREICPKMAALLVSGDTAPERLREADAAGVALLHKPVNVSTLTRAMLKAVGRAG